MQAKNLACQSRAELRRVQLGKIGLKAHMKAPVSCTRVKCDSFFGSSWLSRLSCSLPTIDFHLEHVYFIFMLSSVHLLTENICIMSLFIHCTVDNILPTSALWNIWLLCVQTEQASTDSDHTESTDDESDDQTMLNTDRVKVHSVFCSLWRTRTIIVIIIITVINLWQSFAFHNKWFNLFWAFFFMKLQWN